jgi:formiminotetrahydrofolate cyclodeaminase
MVARCSRDSWPDAAGVAAQANVIRDRAVTLAQTDAKVWQDALSVLAEARTEPGSDERRNFNLEQKLEHAAAAPLEIAELGADAAALAAVAGERCDGTYRADAAAAAALAAGGARAAAHLVQINLGVRPGDARLARARASGQAADDAAARLLESIR